LIPLSEMESIKKELTTLNQWSTLSTSKLLLDSPRSYALRSGSVRPRSVTSQFLDMLTIWQGPSQNHKHRIFLVTQIALVIC